MSMFLTGMRMAVPKGRYMQFFIQKISLCCLAICLIFMIVSDSMLRTIPALSRLENLSQVKSPKTASVSSVFVFQ